MIKRKAYEMAFDVIFGTGKWSEEEANFLAPYAVNRADNDVYIDFDDDMGSFWEYVQDGDKYLSDAKDAWRGCGVYQIFWSDGGRFGDPTDYSSVVELAENLASAELLATETHLPYAEKCN